VLAAGVLTFADARYERAQAQTSFAHARTYRNEMTARVDAARKIRAELKSKLAWSKAKRVQLRVASAGGFVAAQETARARGERAGEAAGFRAGTRDGRAQRSQVPAPGWYYVHVGWRASLPVIDDSYDLDAGPDHAYWVEDNTTWNRETG
jgi:hypothetical protein